MDDINTRILAISENKIRYSNKEHIATKNTKIKDNENMSCLQTQWGIKYKIFRSTQSPSTLKRPYFCNQSLLNHFVRNLNLKKYKAYNNVRLNLKGWDQSCGIFCEWKSSNLIFSHNTRQLHFFNDGILLFYYDAAGFLQTLSFTKQSDN